MWWKRKFKLEGGRAGIIRVREGEMMGELDWEMLTGQFDMVIYARSCRWTTPKAQPMTTDEVLRLAEEVAKDMGIKIDVAL